MTNNLTETLKLDSQPLKVYLLKYKLTGRGRDLRHTFLSPTARAYPSMCG